MKLTQNPMNLQNRAVEINRLKNMALQPNREKQSLIHHSSILLKNSKHPEKISN